MFVTDGPPLIRENLRMETRMEGLGDDRIVPLWLIQHSGSLLTTYLLAYVFFQKFVRPAVGTEFDDSNLFVFCAALAHTWMVAIGFFLAERGSKPKVAAFFCFWLWCGALSFFYSLNIGRFRSWADIFSLPGCLSASIIGAASLSTWLAVAMTVIRSRTGRRLAGGTLQVSHALISAGAACLLALDATPLVCLGTILTGYAAALIAEAMGLLQMLGF